jgi:glycopeptide antibiotics resistance protein
VDLDSFVVVALIAGAFAGVALLPTRLRLPVWIALILLVVLPWRNYQDHTHWSRVSWIPFRSPPPLSIRDVVGNVLLYVPFGAFMVLGRLLARRSAAREGGKPAPPVQGRQTSPLPYLWPIAAAAVLSVATEAAQLYSHGRFPSSTDVVLNVTGAAIGAWLAARTAVT